jgi:membrane associated rhomboid family serine protease
MYLAQNNGLVYYGHEYYEFFTSILVTDYPLDAAFNAIAVLVLDRITEDSLNKTRYIAIFFSTALVGNLFTLVQGPEYASAGASGGIFGIYAALITFSWLKNKSLDVPAVALFLIIFVSSSIFQNVNYVAHIGGAFGGFLAGSITYQSVKPRLADYSIYDSRKTTTIAIAALLFLVTVASAAQFLIFSGA